MRLYRLGIALLSVLPLGAAGAAGLGGSLASMRLQHAVAERSDYTFLKTAAQLREFVDHHLLVPVESSADLTLHEVSFPYARDEVKLFVDRLARQYRAFTGDQLVVTSLTRPLANQPRNSHVLSVHPTGMAADLRVPASAEARQWLETKLLSLEAKGILDVTRERSPAHYHVAVFPKKYAAYDATLPDEPPIPVTLPLPVSRAMSTVPVSASPSAEPMFAMFAVAGLAVAGLIFAAARRRPERVGR